MSTAAGITAKQALEPLSEKVQEKMQVGVEASKRAFKNAREKAGDLVEDATHKIKRHPLQAATVTIAIGIGVGFAAGLVLAKLLAPKRRFFS